MKALLVLAALLAANAVAAEGSSPRRWVHLNNAGLDAMQRDDPERYAAVEEVLRTAQMEPCQTLPRVLKAKSNVAADTVRCEANILKTSFPAKRPITFTIGDTSYSSDVPQLKASGGAIVPAR